MEKLMKFENSNVKMVEVNGVWYFDLYSVGMALGQIKKNSKGVIYPAKDRIDRNCENAEIKPCVRNAHKYITEEQIYDLMLETRTDKCRAFRKWLTNEVLPTLRKTGKYEIPKAETRPYEYFDKTYNSKPVLSVKDVEYITKIKVSTINWFLRTHAILGKDYYILGGDELKNYKRDNPKTAKTAGVLNIVTRNGFVKICKAYGIQVEEPKCFGNKNTDKKSTQVLLINRIIEKLRKNGYDISVKPLTQEIANEYTDGIIRNQSLTVKSGNKYYIFVDDSAPLPNKRYLAAEGIGCVITGQLRGNRKCLVMEYSEKAYSFASALMAISLLFDE